MSTPSDTRVVVAMRGGDELACKEAMLSEPAERVSVSFELLWMKAPAR